MRGAIRSTARAVCFVFAAASIGWAQQEGATLDELARRNAALEARLTALEDWTLDGGLLEDSYQSRGLVARYGEVTTTFQFFGDVGARYQNPEPEGRGNSAFEIGALDFFVSVQMGDHFQVLTETVHHNGHFNLERMWGAWTFNDHLYVKLGLEHSPISHWNRVYHHGAWLELTIERPLLARFEGNSEGFLPLHNSGLEFGGNIDTGAGQLEYTAIVSNGRGTEPTEKQGSSDANDEKALVLALDFAPEDLPSFRFGVAGQLDRIAAQPGAADPALQSPIDQTVASAWTSLDIGRLQMLAEFAHLSDETRADGATFDHSAAYLQLAWRHGNLTPYLRFDWKDMETNDPYLAQADRDLDRWQQIFGIRHDFASQAALKFEVGFGSEDTRGGGGEIGEEDFVTAAVQLSWFL